MSDLADELVMECNRLREHVMTLRAALRPFAACVRRPGDEDNYEGYEAVPPDERPLVIRGVVYGDIRSDMQILVRDLRAARHALDSTEGT